MSEVDINITAEFSEQQFGALDTKLNGIVGAVDKLAENVSGPDTSVAAEIALLRNELGLRLTQLSDNLGKWLAAIALAIADPDNNTAEVQAHIDKVTQQIKQQTDALAAEVEHAKET